MIGYIVRIKTPVGEEKIGMISALNPYQLEIIEFHPKNTNGNGCLTQMFSRAGDDNLEVQVIADYSRHIIDAANRGESKVEVRFTHGKEDTVTYRFTNPLVNGWNGSRINFNFR